MEKHIIKKTESHSHGFKTSIQKWIEEHSAQIKCGSNDITSDFLKFIYDFNGIELNKEDFQKRKRIKNLVPEQDRCIGKRASGERCTRRRNGENVLCGTHIKGTPHGIINQENTQLNSKKKVEVWVQEIKGINYYIDELNNVYKPEDILSNKLNPSIISTWSLTEDGEYRIPDFGI